MIKFGAVIFSVCILFGDGRADDAIQPRGNGILSKPDQLQRFTWWDNRDWDWYEKNIPFFESPDSAIDETYYYRWQLITEHLVYDEPETGYVISEFARPVGWGSPSGAICCAFGLQLNEIRWLRDPRFAQDYTHYWYHSPDKPNPRGYSTWFADAAWERFLVDNDKKALLANLPDMRAQYNGWMKEHWDPNEKLFAWSGMHDGMELTIESRQTADDFAGGNCYRPTLNSYLYGDLTALTKTEQLAGDQVEASMYQQKADDLKSRILDQLWDRRRNFFISRYAENESKDGEPIKAGSLVYDSGKFAGDSHGRELVGYVPWQFNLPPPNQGYEVAWKSVVDPDMFLAPFGLYTVEKHDPLFEISNQGCVWSGENWPYADSQTLIAFANLLNNYSQSVVTKADYFKVFASYTRSQRKDGKPYIAEDQDPDTGTWLQDTPNHSENYCHSSYNDLLITGLVGLRPRADDLVEVNPTVPVDWKYFALDDLNYHGRDLSIIWDQDGSRYRRGQGLTVIADGKVIGSSPILTHVTFPLPPRTPAPWPQRAVDYAVNHGTHIYPLITATYSAPATNPQNLIDGTYYYFRDHPVNRWTTEGSPNPSDAVKLDFGLKRPIDAIRLYVLDDGEGQKVRVPKSVTFQYWTGVTWKEIPGEKNQLLPWTGHTANLVTFPTLQTSQVRVTFTPQPSDAVGLTEIEAWGKAQLDASDHLPQDLALSATASASYTFHEDGIKQINDGKIVFQEDPRNRWTAYNSPNSSDWVQLDFGQGVLIGRLSIAWWADNRGVRLPSDFSLQYWKDDAWTSMTEVSRSPTAPSAGALQQIVIDPVTTTKIRVTFQHSLPGKTGVTEMMVWAK